MNRTFSTGTFIASRTFPWNPGQNSRNKSFQSAFPADTSSSCPTKTNPVCEIPHSTTSNGNSMTFVKRTKWRQLADTMPISQLEQLVTENKLHSSSTGWVVQEIFHGYLTRSKLSRKVTSNISDYSGVSKTSRSNLDKVDILIWIKYTQTRGNSGKFWISFIPVNNFYKLIKIIPGSPCWQWKLSPRTLENNALGMQRPAHFISLVGRSKKTSYNVVSKRKNTKI